MSAEAALKWAIVGPSVFVAGLVFYLGWANLQMWRGDHEPVLIAYVMARWGFGIVIGLIGEELLRAPGIPVTWQAILYATGLLLCSLGYLGIARDHARGTHSGI